MYKNIIRRVLILFILPAMCVNAQVTFSKRMKYSDLASPADKSLFLIDFWATWCAPCINAANYLGDIQAQYPEKLYILSLSKENPDVVEKFLERHHTKLSVAIDYEGNNFQKYQVNALPYSVMLNADGKVVWKGNPSNLTVGQVAYLLQRNRKTIPIYRFLNYIEYQSEIPEEISFEGDYQLTQSNRQVEDLSLISRDGELTIVEGSLKQILEYLLKISAVQLDFASKEGSFPYRLIIKDNALQSDENIAFQILLELGLDLNETKTEGEYYMVDFVDTSHFWDKNEIDWGNKNAKFLIDEQQFTADNISVPDMIYQLSALRNIPFILSRPISKKLFDWEIHYKFDDLMKASLQNYGIRSHKVYGQYPLYIIVKK